MGSFLILKFSTWQTYRVQDEKSPPCLVYAYIYVFGRELEELDIFRGVNSTLVFWMFVGGEPTSRSRAFYALKENNLRPDKEVSYA